MLLGLSDQHTMLGWNVWDRCYQAVLLAKQGDFAIAARLLRAALGDLAKARLRH